MRIDVLNKEHILTLFSSKQRTNGKMTKYFRFDEINNYFNKNTNTFKFLYGMLHALNNDQFM